MTNQFKRIGEHLEIERKRLSEELELKVIPSTDEGFQESLIGKDDETAWEKAELAKRLALAQNIREHLTAVEYALKKLENGTYGLCDACGNHIPLARLEAIPEASLCLDCKREYSMSRMAHSH
jgi:RNA polymerase-binding protein DksA